MKLSHLALEAKVRGVGGVEGPVAGPVAAFVELCPGSRPRRERECMEADGIRLLLRGGREAGLLDFARELLRTMKVRRCKGGSGSFTATAMLAVSEIPLHDRPERGIAEVTPVEAVEERGEAGDRSRGKKPARPENAVTFAESGNPVVSLGQVVEGPEQKDDVVRLAWLLQRACITLNGAEAASRAFDRLLNVERRRVDQPQLVALFGEPIGVCPGSPADVEHPSRRRR